MLALELLRRHSGFGGCVHMPVTEIKVDSVIKFNMVKMLEPFFFLQQTNLVIFPVYKIL